MLKVLSICSFLVIGAAEIGWIFFVVALICGLPILFAAMFAVGSGNTDRLVEVAVRNVKGGTALFVLAVLAYGLCVLIIAVIRKVKS